jgi:hypothetical protein
MLWAQYILDPATTHPSMYGDSSAFSCAAYYAASISVLSNTKKRIDMLSTEMLIDL